MASLQWHCFLPTHVCYQCSLMPWSITYFEQVTPVWGHKSYPISSSDTGRQQLQRVAQIKSLWERPFLLSASHDAAGKHPLHEVNLWTCRWLHFQLLGHRIASRLLGTAPFINLLLHEEWQTMHNSSAVDIDFTETTLFAPEHIMCIAFFIYSQQYFQGQMSRQHNAVTLPSNTCST